MRLCLGTRGGPSDYDKTVAALSRNGSYVLALAFKVLPVGVSLGDLGAWDRSNAERDLTLLGFMTFDNFVKVRAEMSLNCMIQHKFALQSVQSHSRDSLTRFVFPGRFPRSICVAEAGRHRSHHDHWGFAVYSSTLPQSLCVCAFIDGFEPEP